MYGTFFCKLNKYIWVVFPISMHMDIYCEKKEERCKTLIFNYLEHLKNVNHKKKAANNYFGCRVLLKNMVLWKKSRKSY